MSDEVLLTMLDKMTSFVEEVNTIMNSRRFNYEFVQWRGDHRLQESVEAVSNAASILSDSCTKLSMVDLVLIRKRSMVHSSAGILIRSI